MTVSEHRGGGEFITAEMAIAGLPARQRYNATKIARVRSVANLTEHPRVLEIGCSSGGSVIAWRRLGYDCIGLEPSDEGIANSRTLSEGLGESLPIHQGGAEKMPFEDEEFDFVCANSVIEHVQDLDRSMAEIFRVLRPGGCFWFNAASSMCPVQNEIRKFPLFGWYPDPIKQRVMQWAKVHRPELMGYTSYPALQWFTPWKARRVLRKHGFSSVWDRWDVRGTDEGGTAYRMALSVIRSGTLTKHIADIMVPGCSYLARK